MEYLGLFLRCHFAGKPLLVSQNVSFFLRLKPEGISHNLCSIKYKEIDPHKTTKILIIEVHLPPLITASSNFLPAAELSLSNLCKLAACVANEQKTVSKNCQKL